MNSSAMTMEGAVQFSQREEYYSALQLNNIGVSLLGKNCFAEAIVTFKQALSKRQRSEGHILVKESMKRLHDAKTKVYACPLLSKMMIHSYLLGQGMPVPVPSKGRFVPMAPIRTEVDSMQTPITVVDAGILSTILLHNVATAHLCQYYASDRHEVSSYRVALRLFSWTMKRIRQVRNVISNGRSSTSLAVSGAKEKKANTISSIPYWDLLCLSQIEVMSLQSIVPMLWAARARDEARRYCTRLMRVMRVLEDQHGTRSAPPLEASSVTTSTTTASDDRSTPPSIMTMSDVAAAA